MRKSALMAGVFAAALLQAGSALAQGAVIELSPEQERTVYTTVTKERVRTAPPAGLQVSVGAVLPETVELYEVPAAVEIPTVRRYRYTVVDNRVVLVDPGTRRVVRVISR